MLSAYCSPASRAISHEACVPVDWPSRYAFPKPAAERPRRRLCSAVARDHPESGIELITSGSDAAPARGCPGRSMIRAGSAPRASLQPKCAVVDGER
jgi:hypothetical protein